MSVHDNRWKLMRKIFLTDSTASYLFENDDINDYMDFYKYPDTVEIESLKEAKPIPLQECNDTDFSLENIRKSLFPYDNQFTDDEIQKAVIVHLFHLHHLRYDDPNQMFDVSDIVNFLTFKYYYHKLLRVTKKVKRREMKYYEDDYYNYGPCDKDVPLVKHFHSIVSEPEHDPEIDHRFKFI